MNSLLKQKHRKPPLFICESLLEGQPTASISGEDASHALKSRRLRIGDQVQLTNGNGLLGEGTIDDIVARPTEVLVRLARFEASTPAKISLTLASALPKGERLGTMLDMATQLGMNCFIPLDCAYSSVKFQEKMIHRWQRVIRSACKQCRQLYVPTIRSGSDVQSLLQSLGTNTLALYGHHLGAPVRDAAERITATTAEIMIVVGPEGGFNAAEFGLLAQHPQVFGISVSAQILRTETAGVALLGATTGILQPLVHSQH